MKRSAYFSFFCFVCALGVCLAFISCGLEAPYRPSDDSIHHNNLGVALMDAGPKDPKYFPEAIKEFEAALRSSPKYQTARVNLGMAYYYAGQVDLARSTLTAVLADSPDNLHANYVLGLLKEMNGEFAEARVHFGKLVQKDPGDPNSWFHLGYSYFKNRQYQEAIEPFRQAAGLLPYQRRMRYNLYMALSRAGKIEEAQAELENFRKLESSSVRVVEAPKSSVEYLKQGKYAEAIPESFPPSVASQVPAPRYSDVAASLGIAVKAEKVPGDTEISKIMQGEAMPQDWFRDRAHQKKLVAASGAGASFCDFNNDGRLDLFFVTMSGAAGLFEQLPDGHFQDVTSNSNLPGESLRGTACTWGDYDNDGWQDLLVCGYGEIHLFRNKQGKFQDVTRTSAILHSVTPDSWMTGAAFADVDHDGDVDIYVTRLVDLSHIPEKLKLRFPIEFQPQTNLLFRNDGDGTFSEISQEANVAAGNFRSRSVWFSDVNEDRAIDLVLFGPFGRMRLLLNNKDGKFVESSTLPLEKPDVSPLGESRAFGDFDGDGSLDQLSVRANNSVALNRNQNKPANWLKVRLEGYAVPGKVKSNRLGIGTKVEVRSVGQWERKELSAGNSSGGCDAPEVFFDLRSQEQVDFVRAIFPSGVRWTLKNVRSNQVIKVEEPLLDVNSCPTLFAWSGKKFEFVTDTLGAGILGELVAPHQYWQPDPDEWVRITEQQLRPKHDQSVEIRFTNPLEEVTYLDRVALIAVDHPETTEVYSNERMLNEPANRESDTLFVVSTPQPIRRAIDQHGHDVTQILLKEDRQYFDHFAPLPFKGFAGVWSLTIELGEMEKYRNPVLLLNGWSYWNSSASIVAAAQAKQTLWGPVLEVLNSKGRWRQATNDMGIGAGLPRTIAFGLSGLLRPGEHIVRIRSNRTLYYDQIRTADAIETVPLTFNPLRTPMLQYNQLTLTSADLHWLGYPKRILPDNKMPEQLDYDQIETEADWGTHAGLLTHFGEVLPLLTRSDDQYVVMEHGEEISLKFCPAPVEALGKGWKRTYFFYSDGYEKGFELHSAQAETVDSLPYHGMKSYPYFGEIYPSDEEHIQYLINWNTRPSFMRR